ncbi:nitrogenase cofactor biosynthesis protein NifB [Brooklawnia cerclae]|uniref:FeMo cofactor biosynthesis protein NifB n=1 Tax=Brooklawnia cerclae TaxID=349934 RepID=A0ABX0SFC2_9ACTN|nr:nitrogenase cofactor biosynthesis protein NifB [Brooklawnia cerclae]NIH57095.1 nitrogen fixation protein NifB [Brooklawnia cerclae]
MSTAPMTPTRVTVNDHPCFDEAARNRTARVHLPVAPRCNVQCNYCNRKFDCVSESRPGVSSTVLTPEEAADYVDLVRKDVPNLAVVGIAGPGDPFANAEKTLRTLRLVTQRHPDLLLCVSSNGLELPHHLDEVAELNISHVTVTMSTVDPEVAGRIYRWVRDGRQVYRGVKAGELLIERQMESIIGLKERGMVVKINTVLVPGVTLEGIADVARMAGDLGVDLMNCLPLYPVDGTPFGELDAPTAAEIAQARVSAQDYIPQMTHCQRCRADAVGMLGDEHGEDAVARLMAVKMTSTSRPYIAVCSQEGYLVNQHLGGADHVLIYENANIDGRITPRLVGRRSTPPEGGGAGRWAMLAGVLSDCRALICHQLGGSPRMVLQGAGVSVYESDGLITEAVTDVFAGQTPRRALPPRDCATSCSGPGNGCG